MEKRHLVFDYYSKYRGGLGDFIPVETNEFVATQAVPGSLEKVEVLRKRAQMGMPLWHEDDPCY